VTALSFAVTATLPVKAAAVAAAGEDNWLNSPAETIRESGSGGADLLRLNSKLADLRPGFLRL